MRGGVGNLCNWFSQVILPLYVSTWSVWTFWHFPLTWYTQSNFKPIATEWHVTIIPLCISLITTVLNMWNFVCHLFSLVKCLSKYLDILFCSCLVNCGLQELFIYPKLVLSKNCKHSLLVWFVSPPVTLRLNWFFKNLYVQYITWHFLTFLICSAMIK